MFIRFFMAFDRNEKKSTKNFHQPHFVLWTSALKPRKAVSCHLPRADGFTQAEKMLHILKGTTCNIVVLATADSQMKNDFCNLLLVGDLERV